MNFSTGVLPPVRLRVSLPVPVSSAAAGADFLPPRDPVETGRGRGFASRGRAVKTVLAFPWFGALCFKGFRARASPFSPSIHVTSSNFIRDSIDRRPSFEYVFYLVEISGTVRIRPADFR